MEHAARLGLIVLLLHAACTSPDAEETTGNPVSRTDAAPAPDPAAASGEEPVLADAEVPESVKVSGFDSNQWNSSFGLGGGAGGAHGGRTGAVRGSESYGEIVAADFLEAATSPLSTFAADVDTASFANVRRLLTAGQDLPIGSVRVEEFINAMRYDDAEPSGNQPFALAAEMGDCPWQEGHKLARFSLRTRSIDADKVPPCNLVFLIDNSGSMRAADKLPLLVRSMHLLVDQLRPQDSISIVSYAGRAEVVLGMASGRDKELIHAALEAVRAGVGGGTNGEGGIRKAYELANASKVTGCNRVLMATDGDFNVGISDVAELHELIEQQKGNGIFLTVLGFGSGNLRDDRLETLADKGDGVYAYIDGIDEGRRVLVEQFGATMMTVAKDVKMQVEFDPRQIKSYRLIGYENRMLQSQDFRDDNKDGGEMGAGHQVTALYQLQMVDGGAHDGDIAQLRVRYKAPEADSSREVVQALQRAAGVGSSAQFDLAAAAATLGLWLRGDDGVTREIVEKLCAAAPKPEALRLQELLRLAGKVPVTRSQDG